MGNLVLFVFSDHDPQYFPVFGQDLCVTKLSYCISLVGITRVFLSPAGRTGDYKTHSVRVLLSVCHAFIKGCTSHWLFLLGLFNVFL